MNEFKMIVEKAKIEHVVKISKLHKEGIPTGFLSKQSDDFLINLYKYLIKNEIVFVAKDEANDVIGFVSATLTTQGLYKKFLKSNFSVLLKFIFKNLFSIEFLKKSFETFLAPKKTQINELQNDLSELLSIVVDKNTKSKGIGQALVDALDNELSSIGVKEYKVLVGTKLPANKFYQKKGFKLYKEVELHKGEKSNIYIKNTKG